MPLKAQTEKAETCYTNDQIHSLAKREVQCQKCEVDFSILQKTYNDVITISKPPMTLGDKIKTEVLGYTISFGLGAIFIATKCFGVCK